MASPGPWTRYERKSVHFLVWRPLWSYLSNPEGTSPFKLAPGPNAVSSPAGT